MKDLMTKPEADRTTRPACSIFGDDATVVLRVEMPGVAKEAVEIRIDNDQLTISGQLPPVTEQGSWLLRERRTNHYFRSFTLDNTIDRDRVDAVYDLGVMTITLHVKEEVKPRRIPINPS